MATHRGPPRPTPLPQSTYAPRPGALPPPPPRPSVGGQPYRPAYPQPIQYHAYPRPQPIQPVYQVYPQTVSPLVPVGYPVRRHARFQHYQPVITALPTASAAQAAAAVAKRVLKAQHPHTRPLTPSVRKGGDSDKISLFVSRLTEDVDDDFIETLFSKCGEIASWKRLKDTFGFMTYRHPDGALRCLRILKGMELGGKHLVVNVDAKSKVILQEYEKKQQNITNRKEDDNDADEVALALIEAMIEERDGKKPTRKDYTQKKRKAEKNSREFSSSDDDSDRESRKKRSRSDGRTRSRERKKRRRDRDRHSEESKRSKKRRGDERDRKRRKKERKEKKEKRSRSRKKGKRSKSDRRDEESDDDKQSAKEETSGWVVTEFSGGKSSWKEGDQGDTATNVPEGTPEHNVDDSESEQSDAKGESEKESDHLETPEIAAKETYTQQELIEFIPKDTQSLFVYKVPWRLVDDARLIDKTMSSWIDNRVKEYLGDKEEDLVNFVVGLLKKHTHPEEIIKEMSMVLVEDAEAFVTKMWRRLIFESLKIKYTVTDG